MKNNTILLITALLGAAMSGSTHADPAPTSTTAPAAASTSQEDQSGSDIGSGPVRFHPRFYVPTPPVSTDEVIDVGGSEAFCQKGKVEINKGNWHAALTDFQQALSLLPESPEALYGKAQCIAALGDTAAALKTYRALVYTSDPSRFGITPGDGFQENGVTHLMQFALLLNKTGQTAEAISVYSHGAYFLDYEKDQFNVVHQTAKVLWPELVEVRTLGGQVRYTPERLQALAETGIAHEEMAFGSDKEAVAHLRDAVKLYPDSPVTYYYLGNALLVKDRVGAKAAYQKAVQLGDVQTAAAVKNQLGTL